MHADRVARLQQSCLARANQPLPADRLRLMVAGLPCGWVDARSAACLARPPSPFTLDASQLRLAPALEEFDICSRALNEAATRLRDSGRLPGWRNEQLDVHADDGRRLATIERAACRALGIATRSVHLNAFTSNGELLAARRAAHKTSDPGRWDNLAGGMVAAGESDRQALAREAHEEAGLELDGLTLSQGAELRVQRPVAEGLMIETVQVFDVQLSGMYAPRNLDGEVAEFGIWPVDHLMDAIERGEFTLEASLATLDALARRWRSR